jgi:hypothetical protein
VLAETAGADTVRAMRIQGLLVASAFAGASALAGCSGDGQETAAPGTFAATSASGSSASPTTGPASLHPDGGALPDGWPAEAAPEHGAQVWAVYLAVGPEGDPELAEAREYLDARGYSTAEGRELGCDGGAAEALGRDPREHAVAVYFDWRADAGDFVAMLKPAGSQPEEVRGFVEMLRVTRDCIS